MKVEHALWVGRWWRYEGDFELARLGPHGMVRSAGDDTGACEVRNMIDDGEWVRVPLGWCLLLDINGEFRCAPVPPIS